MEESLRVLSHNSVVPSEESKHNISTEVTCDSSKDTLCSQEDLLYGNETESLVTEKILNQLEHPKIAFSDSNKQSETENESSCKNTTQLQSIYPEADINHSETETLVAKEINKCKEEGSASWASPQVLVEGEISSNKIVNDLEAVFSGSESDHSESPVLHQKHRKVLEKDKNSVTEQVCKPKSLPALSLVAEYADSGNDTEEELPQVKNPVSLQHLETQKRPVEDCVENSDKQSIDANECMLGLNVNKTLLDSCSSGKEPVGTMGQPVIPNITVSEETVHLRTLGNPSLKECRWSEDEDKELKSKWEVDEKMESESSSESVEKDGEECASADLDSDRVKKQKDSSSKEKRHKKKRKKKSRKASSNEQDTDKKERRKEKSKSSHKDRSRHDSSSESEGKNDKDHHSVDPSAEHKRQSTNHQKKSRSRSRTPSPKKQNKHHSRSHSHNRSRSRSQGSSAVKKQRRHSRSRSRDKSSRKSMHSPSSRRKSSRRSRSRSQSRNRSRTRDSHSRRSSSSYRRRDRSRDRQPHSETRGRYKSSRERSPRRKSHYSPRRRESSDSHSSSKKEKQRVLQESYKAVPPSVSITAEEDTHKTQKIPHTEERPSEKQSSIDIPSERQSSIDIPSERQSSVGKPSDRQSSIDKPSKRQSGVDKPSERQSSIDKPFERQSSVGKPSERQSSIDKPSERQSSVGKPKKEKVIPSPKSENSDEELWAELEQLTYSSSAADQKTGKLHSRRAEDNARKHVKDDILPLVSIPDSPRQEERKRRKTENVKKTAYKYVGLSLWKPLKLSSNSGAEEVKQESKPGETAQVVELKTESLDTQEDQPVMSTVEVANSLAEPGDRNKDVAQSEERQQKMDTQTPPADRQKKLDTQTPLEDSQQGVETETPSDKPQDMGIRTSPADGQQDVDKQTPLAKESQSKTREEPIKTSEETKSIPQDTPATTDLHQTSEEEAEKKPLLETPPESLIKPFVSQFTPMQPTVIPGLDLMNPNFKSPPPPPPPPFSQGGMNPIFPPSSHSIPLAQGVTGVRLQPPPLPPWARFTPPPGQHQLPPPSFPPANVPPPSLLSLRLPGPPPWGGPHMQQNMPNFAAQNQNRVNPQLFPPQAANFKITPPLMGLGTASAPRKLQSSENTDGKPEHQTAKGQMESLGASNAETDGMDSVSTPMDMEMSSPEVDIIDKLNEEFWESQQKEHQEAANVDEDAADVDEDVTYTEEDSFLDDTQLSGVPSPHSPPSPASPVSPPSQAFPVSPPYSPGGEEVNLGIPEVFEMKRERREKKDKSKKKKKKAKLSAKSLSVIDRIHRQARVEEEAKHVLRIYYKHRDINKEEYKSILRRAVPQVTNSNHSIDPERIRHLVKKYVAKIKGQRLLKQDAR